MNTILHSFHFFLSMTYFVFSKCNHIFCLFISSLNISSDHICVDHYYNVRFLISYHFVEGPLSYWLYENLSHYSGIIVSCIWEMDTNSIFLSHNDSYVATTCTYPVINPMYQSQNVTNLDWNYSWDLHQRHFENKDCLSSFV